MSNDKCGINEHRRHKILKDMGFVLLRDGKGSHAQWEHPEMHRLLERYRIEPPQNARAGISLWQTTVPDDPASGTWRAIIAHAEWISRTVSDIKTHPERYALRSQLAQDFSAVRNRPSAGGGNHPHHHSANGKKKLPAHSH